MSSKRKVKLLIFDEWELEEQESWLQDMAGNGWHLVHFAFGFAEFVKGEPAKIQYRLEVAAKNRQLEDEQIELYEAAGWEHVTSRRFIHVFREKKAGETVEIHTDPVIQAGSIKRLKRNILSRGFTITFFTILIIILQGYRFINPTSYDLLENNLLSNIIFTLIYLLLAVYMIRGMIHISLLIRKLKRNEMFNHEKPYQRKKIMRKVFFLIYIGLFLILIIFMFNETRQMSPEKAYPEIPDSSLPVVTLLDVEQVQLKKVSFPTNGIERKRENHFLEQSSIFVPKQIKLEQRFTIPAKTKENDAVPYTASISSYRYDALTESIAKKLVDALKDERGLEDYEEIHLTGYDEAWLEEQNNYISIIARTENTVTDIGYTGDESSRVLIDLLEERENEEGRENET